MKPQPSLLPLRCCDAAALPLRRCDATAAFPGVLLLHFSPPLLLLTSFLLPLFLHRPFLSPLFSSSLKHRYAPTYHVFLHRYRLVHIGLTDCQNRSGTRKGKPCYVVNFSKLHVIILILVLLNEVISDYTWFQH